MIRSFLKVDKDEENKNASTSEEGSDCRCEVTNGGVRNDSHTKWTAQ